MVRGLRKIATLASMAAASIGGVCLVLMMLQMVLDVILKFFLNAPIEGSLEVVSYYYMVAVVFLPFGLVELKHEHINVDMFVSWMPMGWKNAIYILAGVMALVFLSMLTYQTTIDALHATSINEVVMGTRLVPIWLAKWALPVGFFVMMLAVGANILQAAVNFQSFEPKQDAPSVE